MLLCGNNAEKKSGKEKVTTNDQRAQRVKHVSGDQYGPHIPTPHLGSCYEHRSASERNIAFGTREHLFPLGYGLQCFAI